jgi:hypothetical protein
MKKIKSIIENIQVAVFLFIARVSGMFDADDEINS